MKALRLAVQVGLIALCLVPVGRQLVQSWDAIGTWAARLSAPAVAGAALLLVLSSLFLPLALSAFTAGGGPRARIGYRNSAAAYYASQPMKYLPGSFWVLPGRVVLLQRLGHAPAVSTGGLLFEMAGQALSGAVLAAGLLAAAPGLLSRAPAGTAAAVGVVLGGAALGCLLLLSCPAALSRQPRMPAAVREAGVSLAAIPPRRRMANLAVTLAAFAAMWLLAGLSFYLLLVADAPRFSAGLLLTALGVSTLSALAGLLTPFSPGGIGVREAAVVLLLAGVIPAAQATLLAVLSRVLALVVEMGFALAAWAAMRPRQKDRPAPSQLPLRISLPQAQPVDASWAVMRQPGRCYNGRKQSGYFGRTSYAISADCRRRPQALEDAGAHADL